MMAVLAPAWPMDVERGPDWLFVRPHPPAGDTGEEVDLVIPVWALLEQHLTYRLVLELDELNTLPGSLIGQLVMLEKRIQAHDGVLRLAGLSAACRRALDRHAIGSQVGNYASRAEAVGRLPWHPR